MTVDSLVLLFAKSAELYTPLLNNLVLEVSGVKYDIMAEESFRALMARDPHAANQLKVLNEFPIKTLHSKTIDHVHMKHFAEWQKIAAVFFA